MDAFGRVRVSASFHDRGARGLHHVFFFQLQTLALARDGEWLFATLNAIGSFVLCLFAVWLGDHLAVLLNQR